MAETSGRQVRIRRLKTVMWHCTYLTADDGRVVEEDKVDDYSHEG